MEKADYFKVYGYLLALRDTYEQKARDAARRDDDFGKELVVNYTKEVVELNRLMSAVNDEGYSL